MVKHYSEVESNFIFKFCYYFIYPVLKFYFNAKLTNTQNLPKHKKSVIFISRHSSHNFEILLGMFLFYDFYKKPMRGIGHYLINFLSPHYESCGVVVGTRSNIHKLIDNNELVYILPGGAEEMLIGSENAYKLNWISKSGNYRTGFTQIALNRDIEIVPIAGYNIEEMSFAPFIIIAN